MRDSVLIFVCFLVCQLIFGAVSAYPAEDYSKVLVLHLTISSKGVSEQSVEMQYGHPPNLGLQAGDIHGTLKTSDGKILKEFDIWDPRYQLSDGFASDSDRNLSLAGEVRYSDTGDLTLVMPYYKDQISLELTDRKTGRLLRQVNFSDAIGRFRSVYPADPNVGTPPGFQFRIDGSLLNMITGCVLIILLVVMILSMVKKK